MIGATEKMFRILPIALISLIGCEAVQQLNQRSFPTHFSFGVATSAYQVEGAWNESGKGVNIWDTFTHKTPSRVFDGTTGDVACDSYHKVPVDIQLLKNLGVQYYRFSISWSRILPTGYTDVINQDGVNYYNGLINNLLNQSITPIVTMFHWDLPQPLEDIGGWPNSDLADYYVDYANLLFKLFGDRVKNWITINEPKQICKLSYGDGILAPGLTSSGIADYKCVATLLIAHARAYRLYQLKYKILQKGSVGITVDSFLFQAATNSSADIAAADRLFQFYTGIFTNPIFGTGDFPSVVKNFVAERSKKQGFPKSRLPTLSLDQILLIRGSSDFFGLNFYTAMLVQNAPEANLSIVSWDSDSRVTSFYDSSWPSTAASWLKVTPWALKYALRDLKIRYGNVPILITENGYPDTGDLNDYDRANFLLTYLSSALDAIYTYGVNLKAYIHWSLLDNFEWIAGFSERFGLHFVDFTNPSRPRTAKYSVGVFSNVTRTRKLPATTIPLGTLQDIRLN